MGCNDTIFTATILYHTLVKNSTYFTRYFCTLFKENRGVL
nr:MAG TPA: hypothetical protein [Caudoviricetes sp.]